MPCKEEKTDIQSSALCDPAQDAAWEGLERQEQIRGWLSGKRKGVEWTTEEIKGMCEANRILRIFVKDVIP